MKKPAAQLPDFPIFCLKSNNAFVSPLEFGLSMGVVTISRYICSFEPYTKKNVQSSQRTVL